MECLTTTKYMYCCMITVFILVSQIKKLSIDKQSYSFALLLHSSIDFTES